jgi:hypothetical protein
MEEESMTFPQAMDFIYRKNGTFQARVDKTKGLRDSLEGMKEYFKTLGVEKTKRQIFQLSRNKVDAILEGILPFVAMKRALLVQLSHDVKAQSDLHAELKTCVDPVRIAEIMKKVDDFNNDTDKEYMAFKDPVTKQVDWQKWTASTYHDEIQSNHNGSFRYWFICLCNFGYGEVCGTLILSKKWGRKFQDPGASKNKWKCTVCNGNYSSNWGVIIEISEQTPEGPLLHYMKAPIPTESYLDIKAKEIQETVAKNAATSRAVYNSIPMFAPAVSSLIGVINEEKGQYKFLDKNAYKTLPLWSWNDILTLGLSMAEGKSLALSMAKLDDIRNGIEEV